MLVDIVLLPPEKISRRLGNISSAIAKKFPLKFAVDNRKLLPHLSLYHLAVKPRSLLEMKAKLEVLSLKSRSINMAVTAPQTGSFYFVYNIKNPPALKNLHQDILKNISPLRQGSVPWIFKMNAAEKKLYKKYGVPNVLGNFNPHFTLGWADKAEDVKKIFSGLKKFQKSIKTFKANRLAIAKINKYYQVTKIIKEFKLK